jgi:hypothetical protein
MYIKKNNETVNIIKVDGTKLFFTPPGDDKASFKSSFLCRFHPVWRVLQLIGLSKVP